MFSGVGGAGAARTRRTFFDEKGRLVNHSINERVMSIPIPTLAATPIRVLVSGGSTKIKPLIGAFTLLRPTALITDEATAARPLEEDVAARPV